MYVYWKPLSDSLTLPQPASVTSHSHPSQYIPCLAVAQPQPVPCGECPAGRGSTARRLMESTCLQHVLTLSSCAPVRQSPQPICRALALSVQEPQASPLLQLSLTQPQRHTQDLTAIHTALHAVTPQALHSAPRVVDDHLVYAGKILLLSHQRLEPYHHLHKAEVF